MPNAAMQAKPEVMRYLVTGRASTRVEVWRTMATFLGQWALRSYGMWACVKTDPGMFVGSVEIFEPLDWPEPRFRIRSTNPSGVGLRDRRSNGRARLVFCAHPLRCAASFIRPDNYASKRVAERLGANFEDTIELRGPTYGALRQPYMLTV
jgi:RimJ/RimL family protein N-acetyltransferase